MPASPPPCLTCGRAAQVGHAPCQRRSLRLSYPTILLSNGGVSTTLAPALAIPNRSAQRGQRGPVKQGESGPHVAGTGTARCAKKRQVVGGCGWPQAIHHHTPLAG